MSRNIAAADEVVKYERILRNSCKNDEFEEAVMTYQKSKATEIKTFR